MKPVGKHDPFFRAVDFYEPYVIARPAVAERLQLSNLGIPLQPANVFNPQALADSAFIDLVYRLHHLVCGPFGMPMERWVGYDCGLVPGVVFGLGRPRHLVPPQICAGLDVSDGYDRLVPFSVGIAIPLPDRSTWLVHALGSLNQVAPGAGPPGLKRLSLVFGSEVLRAEHFLTVVRWRSRLMSTFASLSPIRVETAWTPGHDYPSSVTGRVLLNDAAREHAMQAKVLDHGESNYIIDADDLEGMQALQRDIEEGVTVHIVGPGHDLGTAVHYPLSIHPEPRYFTGQPLDSNHQEDAPC